MGQRGALYDTPKPSMTPTRMKEVMESQERKSRDFLPWFLFCFDLLNFGFFLAFVRLTTLLCFLLGGNATEMRWGYGKTWK